MCLDPVTASIALGAAGLGNFMQQKENNKNVNRQYDARNAVAQEGVAQQDADAAKSGAVLNNTINGFQAPQQGADLGSLITARQNTINNNTGTPSSIIDPTANANAPQVVQSDLANKMAGATAFGNQQGNALGKIGGNTDQMAGNEINLNTSGQKIGQLDNFALGDYKTNQAQQKSAYANARKSANPLWGILSQAGNAAGMYAAGGGSIGDLFSSGPAVTATGMTAPENAFLSNANASAYGAPALPWS